jgi:hypothetical protein
MVRYTVYTDGAHYYKACKWLRIKHIVYDDNDDNDKNIMELYST